MAAAENCAQFQLFSAASAACRSTSVETKSAWRRSSSMPTSSLRWWTCRSCSVQRKAGTERGRWQAREAADPGRDQRNGRKVVLAVVWSIRGLGAARPERSETLRACACANGKWEYAS
eukprot:6431869-Prymnesium_polylepis.1